MSICTGKLARLKARLLVKNAQLEKAYESYDKLLSNEVEEYKFNSNEGSQSAVRRKLDELTKVISTLESNIESLENRICGKGIMYINTRRKGFC